jgi:hypothetical protein
MAENDKIENKKTITIIVNGNPVAFTDHEVTGLQIKEAAINQGVAIQLDFNLFEIKEKKLKPVQDTATVSIHKDQEFRAVTPDDNS